jgi:hypothetical protein
MLSVLGGSATAVAAADRALSFARGEVADTPQSHEREAIRQQGARGEHETLEQQRRTPDRHRASRTDGASVAPRSLLPRSHVPPPTSPASPVAPASFGSSEGPARARARLMVFLN